MFGLANFWHSRQLTLPSAAINGVFGATNGVSAARRSITCRGHRPRFSAIAFQSLVFAFTKYTKCLSDWRLNRDRTLSRGENTHVLPRIEGGFIRINFSGDRAFRFVLERTFGGRALRRLRRLRRFGGLRCGGNHLILGKGSYGQAKDCES